MLGALIGLLALGGGASALAGGIAYALGPSPRRMLAIAALGIPLVAGLFFWAWLAASPTEACWECGQLLGRWMSGVLVFYLLVNAVAWISGAVVGWALRRTRSGGTQVGPLY
jgi:hypothetical protein